MPAPLYPLNLPKPTTTGTHRSAIGLLLLAVLLAHVLLLQAQPLAWALTQNTDSPHTAAFSTRRIAPVPEPQPLPAVPAAKRPVPKPIAQPAAAIAAPVSPENTDLAHADTAPVAIDSVANTSTALADSSQISATAASAAVSLQRAPSQSAAAPVKLAPSAKLAYKLLGMSRGLNYYASSALAWQLKDGGYDLHLSGGLWPLGTRHWTSVGQVGPGGLAPARYADKYKTEVAAHFEPDKQQIIFSANTPTLAWQSGAQDQLSVFFQLGGLLAADPGAFTEGSSVSFYTVGPRSADTWTFVMDAPERLQLPWGELQTLKLTRQPGRDYDKKVEIWYAPALHYLPVRQKVTQQNGDFIDQQLNDWQLL